MSVIFHGEQFAGYRIIELIGWSGLATVYHAHDPVHGRAVALKILDRRPDELSWQRLVRESATAAGLHHPHIVPVHETGEAEGRRFIAMRYVPGGDLEALLAGGRQLDTDRVVALLTEVAGALDAAHTRGLVHGDVRPANILVETAGGTEHAQLAGFGGVWIQDAGATSTEYLAPEQIGGGAVDARTDVYALGAVLHRCLAAPAPFSAGLDEVVGRALAPRTEDRYPTAGALLAAVGQALGDPAYRDTVATTLREAAAHPRRPRPRTPLLVAALAAIVLGAAGGLALSLHGHDATVPAAAGTPGVAAVAPAPSPAPSTLPGSTATAVPTPSPSPDATAAGPPAGPAPAPPQVPVAAVSTAAASGGLFRETVSNTGQTVVVAGASSLSSTAAFTIVSDGCAGAHLPPGAGCVITVRFQPHGPGDYTTVLSVPITGAQPVTFTLRGHRA
ncbi:MAG TPA: serine/threonine-protein kinase [Candidatus Dormibacteraeota bacterium]